MGIDKLDTVRKLLAKADGAATPAEAEVYTAKAVELMARHGIDEALLAAAAPRRDEVATCRIPVADPYSAGKARLLAWTASALRCRAVLHEAGGRAGRGGHRARFRFRPGAGRAVVHVVAAAGELPAGVSSWRGRANRSPRTGGRGCTGSRCGGPPGPPRPKPGRRSRRPQRGRRRRPGPWRWRSPIAARGSIWRTPRIKADRPGPAGAAVRVGLRGGRPRRGAGGPGRPGGGAYGAAGPSMASRAPAPARRAAPRAAGWSPAGHARHPARRVRLAPRALLPCRGRRSKRLRRGRAAQSPAVAGSVGSGA